MYIYNFYCVDMVNIISIISLNNRYGGKFMDNSESEKYQWSIDDYIKDDCSICREERQYALYLSNILRYSNNREKWNEKDLAELNKILTACELNNNIVVEKVFYEATFMRDIFERNRRYYLTSDKSYDNLINTYACKQFRRKNWTVDASDSFNHKLIEFCCKKNNIPFSSNSEIKEINYGRDKNDPPIPGIKKLIAAMMNSKPDLGIIYKENGDKFLLFIECKFESYETQKNGFFQTDIQGCIADFLCNNGYLPDVSVSKIMGTAPNYHSKKVIFVRTDPKNENEEINISKLIGLEKKIFSRE